MRQSDFDCGDEIFCEDCFETGPYFFAGEFHDSMWIYCNKHKFPDALMFEYDEDHGDVGL